MWFGKKQPPRVVDKSGQDIRQRPKTDPAKVVRQDRGIRAYRADDPNRKAEDEFKRKSREQQIEDSITAQVEHVRKANDPVVQRLQSERELARFVADETITHVQWIGEGTKHQKVVLHLPPARSALHDLRWSLNRLLPKAVRVNTNPKAPRRDPWWTFVKDTRLKTGEEG